MSVVTACQQMQLHSLSADAVTQLVQGDWPALQGLDISMNQRDHSFGSPAFIEELGKAGWTALQHLNLSANELDDRDIRLLGQLNQVHLRSLDVSDCFGWEENSVHEMHSFDATSWPQLTSLDVSDNGLDGNTIRDMLMGACLKELKLGGNNPASWPWSLAAEWRRLESLDLRGSKLSPEDLCTMLQSCSPSFTGFQLLETLYVSCQVSKPTQARPDANCWPRHIFLDMIVVAEVDVLHSLCLGHWPAQSVTLTKNDDGMQSITAELEALVQWDLGVMESLCLQDLGIGRPQAMPNVLHVLCQGKWPKLQMLNLSWNCLQSRFEHILMQAKWPELTFLNLSKNSFSRRTGTCIEAYMKQYWPGVSVHTGYPSYII